MKAWVDGFELEGTVEELNEFVRQYIQSRRALPPPKEEPAQPAPQPASKQVHNPQPGKPTKCDICGREFAGKGYKSPHRVMRIHRAQAHGKQVDHGPYQVDEETKHLVLSRLYPKPQSYRLYSQQGKTSEQLAKELSLDRADISKALTALWHENLAVHEGDGSSEKAYWWFRK